MVCTPGRMVRRSVVVGGRVSVVSRPRLYLWDNPELRRAYREAARREAERRGRSSR